MVEKTPDLEIWGIDDAAWYAGISRQRLNDLLRRDVYPFLLVPNRQNPDARPRARLLIRSVVEQIKVDRGEAQEKQAELEAAARQRRNAR